MVGKGVKADPPGWKALLLTASTTNALNDRIELVKPVANNIQIILDEHASQPPGSQKLFSALGVGQLTNCISTLDPESPTSSLQLLAINDVLAASDPRLAVVLVEQQFLTPLVRLYKKAADASSPLSQTVILVICTTVLLAGSVTGDLESAASQPELVELLISQLIFLSLNPSVLLSPSGLGTAQRCVQLCWELTRAPTPHCKAFRELLQRIDMAARLILIAATVMGRGPSSEAPPSEAAGDTAAALAAVSSLEGLRAAVDAGVAGAGASANSGGGAAVAPAVVVPVATRGGELYEERLALAAQSASFVANLGGLGTRGIQLSSAGLAPQRAWLLRPGTLAALRAPLEGLVDGVSELRGRIEAEGQAVASSEAEATGAEQEEEEDLRPGRLPKRRLLDQVEGAIRNVLMLLGLPTIVMGNNEEDVVEACGFVIRHAFGLFTEGYVDTMKAMRAAVADPAQPASGGGTPVFTAPYPGDYGPFFRAYAGHVETVAPALGVQLEDWGVRFTGEQAARDLPVMEVGEGVDARIAHSWLKGQIQDIINWGHAMMTLVRMADQAKMAASQQHQQQQQAKAAQTATPVAAAAAAPTAGGAVAPPTAHCARCAEAPSAEGPPFQLCSRCRGVRYCSKACQVGHWPQHKASCNVAAAAAAAAAAPPPPAAARAEADGGHSDATASSGATVQPPTEEAAGVVSAPAPGMVGEEGAAGPAASASAEASSEAAAAAAGDTVKQADADSPLAAAAAVATV